MPAPAGPPSKEAVVFLLDANPTMQTPYPRGATDGSTRLSCAKDAMEDMISSLMIQSTQNEVAVIVLKTKATQHHPVDVGDDDDDEEEDAFPNLTEYPQQGVSKPSVELLRQIRSVQSVSAERARRLRGDVCDGIILAADALYRKTHGKRFRRRLVLFTDAAHEIKTDYEQVIQKILSLRALDCTLTVIGLDFSQSAEFEVRADPVESSSTAAVEANNEDDMEEGESEDGEPDEGDSDDETEEASEASEEEWNDEYAQNVKRENEKLLISVARLTGGSVVAASTMRKIADATLGKRTVKSTRRKVKFHIAPGLVLDARFSLLLKKEPLPSLKKSSVILDPDLQPQRDGANEIRFGPVKSLTSHFDADDRNVNLEEEHMTRAYKYGSDYIPMGALDTIGLGTKSEVSIKITGYTDRDKIPRSLLIGPPYGLAGHDSQRVCGAIAALAQALYRLRKVAICSFIKSASADPILAAIFPLEEQETIRPSRLLMLQLPFASDVNALTMPSLNESLRGGDDDDDKACRVCDDLIDSLMLPQDSLRSECIANPAVRSFHKTVKGRALMPGSDVIVAARSSRDSLDPLSTPSNVLLQSTYALKAFRQEFPLEKTEQAKKGTKTKKYWMDVDLK